MVARYQPPSRVAKLKQQMEELAVRVAAFAKLRGVKDKVGKGKSK